MRLFKDSLWMQLVALGLAMSILAPVISYWG